MDYTIMLMFAILFLSALWLFIAFAIYFIPVVIAYIRKHKNILSISILTIFLGWTFFGWLAALLWSLNSDIQSEYE